MANAGRLTTGQTIGASGVYRVYHAAHRLPHEVTLLKGEMYPRCQRCDNLVEFEPVLLTDEWIPRRGPRPIVVYELPEVTEPTDTSDAA